MNLPQDEQKGSKYAEKCYVTVLIKHRLHLLHRSVSHLLVLGDIQYKMYQTRLAIHTLLFSIQNLSAASIRNRIPIFQTSTVLQALRNNMTDIHSLSYKLYEYLIYTTTLPLPQHLTSS